MGFANEFKGAGAQSTAKKASVKVRYLISLCFLEIPWGKGSPQHALLYYISPLIYIIVHLTPIASKARTDRLET